MACQHSDVTDGQAESGSMVGQLEARGRFAPALSYVGADPSAAKLTGNAVDWTPEKLGFFVVTLAHLQSNFSHVRILFPKLLR